MMKRKLRLGALLSVSVLMLALLIGGLYGYFEDTETSTGNKFTAGTLDLVSAVAGTTTGPSMNVVAADPPNSAAGHVEFGDPAGIAPGEGGTITWTLTNIGNVNGEASWSVDVAGVVNDENTVWEPEAEYGDVTPLVGELGGAIDVDIDVSIDGGAFTNEYSGTLDGLAGQSGALSSLNPGAHTVDYRLTWSIPDDLPSVDNLFQSDIATLDIVFSLAQA